MSLIWISFYYYQQRSRNFAVSNGILEFWNLLSSFPSIWWAPHGPRNISYAEKERRLCPISFIIRSRGRALARCENNPLSSISDKSLAAHPGKVKPAIDQEVSHPPTPSSHKSHARADYTPSFKADPTLQVRSTLSNEAVFYLLQCKKSRLASSTPGPDKDRVASRRERSPHKFRQFPFIQRTAGPKPPLVPPKCQRMDVVRKNQISSFYPH